MTLTVVALDPHEKFIRFIDTDLIDIKETIEYSGLRTIDVEYKFQEFLEDKQIFKQGNKLWIQGDNRDSGLKDCLYVINTDVEQDMYKENSFSFTAEEVLVELNNAPLFSHTELTDNETKDSFRLVTTNGVTEVYIDWNSLDYWFGAYFNIGVVQDCLSDYAQRINITGTTTLMALLRKIETESGNVFVTRYEKDCLNNTIHRYLDFLNPVSIQKDWTYNLTYNFLNQDVIVVPDDKPWEITPFNTGETAESIPEDDYVTNGGDDGSSHDTTGSEKDSTYDYEDDKFDETLFEDIPAYNLNPDNCIFRIVDENSELVNNLWWAATDVGFENTNDNEVLISLVKNKGTIGVDVNEKSFAVTPDYSVIDAHKYLEELRDNGFISVEEDNLRDYVVPDDSYFEIYDTVNEMVLFRTCLNIEIGHVHTEVLDLGYNVENITLDVDESNTYTAVSPVLSLDNNSGSSSLTKNNLSDLITRFKALKITKGDLIPMIIQRINVKASSLNQAKSSMGDCGDATCEANQSTNPANWWCRPYKPQDNINESTPADSTFEFLRATAYWKAPYTKNEGELHVATDKTAETEYQYINTRTDARQERMASTPKMGTTETSDEDIYAIYNQVALYLRDHETPDVSLDVDVANLRNKQFNPYNLHDKVYIKVRGNDEIITARVTKVTRVAHDVAKTTVELSNYTELNTIKTLTHETIIHADTLNFKYPNKAYLQVQLENMEYDPEDEYSIQYPANKLLTFVLYDSTDGSDTFKKIYTRVTDANGKAKIALKLDPGKYKVKVQFGGDEEFEESSVTAKVKVSGKKKVKKETKTTTKSKTTKKTKVTKTTYYDKYGRSPDKKKILAIGRISAARDKGSYKDFFEMEFENYCPKCGKKGTLIWGIFYAGNEHSNYGKFPYTGNREGSSAEGAIVCSNPRCDSDWSCQGNEHGYQYTKLRVTKKRKKVDKSKAYKLRQGKVVYQSSTKEVDDKSGKNKSRKIKASGISSKVKKLALDIVGNSTGYTALRKICTWMDKHIWYGDYPNFRHSPDHVLSTKHGNCCDQTRLILQLFDAAGLTEYYIFKYRHVYGHVYALATSRKTGHTVTIDPASNDYGCYGYVCRDYRTRALRETVYPTRPF